MAGRNEFEPDWTLAPAACLREWMTDNNLSARVLATAAVGRAHADEAAKLITEVLDRKPLTELHARILAKGTGIPESFWRNYEANYRAGLAAGLKDCTPEDATVTPESHVIYCRGCQRAWTETIVRPLAEEDHGTSNCSCTCADDTDPHFEDWAVDPDPAEIPEGAWD